MKTKEKKRVFKKIVTVTYFEIFEITDETKVKLYHNEKGESVRFDRRASAERFCEKNRLCYAEVKHIFYR